MALILGALFGSMRKGTKEQIVSYGLDIGAVDELLTLWSRKVFFSLNLDFLYVIRS